MTKNFQNNQEPKRRNQNSMNWGRNDRWSDDSRDLEGEGYAEGRGPGAWEASDAYRDDTQLSPRDFNDRNRDYDQQYGRNYSYREWRDNSSKRGVNQAGQGLNRFNSQSGSTAFGSGTTYGTDSEYGRKWDTASTHFGKGPKGYKRSDDRIREDVCEALYAHPEVDASEIEVKVAEGVVTLTGTVDDRRLKRLAETAVEDCSGVTDVHNQLKVSSRTETDSTSTSRASTKSSSVDKTTR